MCQCYTFKFIAYVSEFNSFRFQEVSTSWNIIEQVFYFKTRSFGTHNLFICFNGISLHFNECAGVNCFFFCAHAHMCNRGDGGKGFSTKSFCLQLKQIVCTFQFTGSMALKTLNSILWCHAISVIHYLYQGFTGILQIQLNKGGSCIDGIFHEFFDNRSWTLDDLSCSNLIGNMFRK